MNDHYIESKAIEARGGKPCTASVMTFGGKCLNCGKTYDIAGNRKVTA